MCYDTLKYGILERLRQLPMNDYKRLRSELPQKLCVSKSVFKRWLYLKRWDKTEIPLSYLREIAKHLNCDFTELINY